MNENATADTNVNTDTNTDVNTEVQNNNVTTNTENATADNPLSDVFNAVEENNQNEQVNTTIPESYDLKLNDGSELEKEDYDRLNSVFKSAGVTQEQAQKILSAYENEVTGYQGKITEQINSQRNEWIADIQNDKELGGANFENTKANLRAVIQKYGNQQLADFLNQSSLGYNPDFVRFMNTIGNAMRTEQKFVNATTNNVVSEKERYAKMYPKSPNLWKDL